MIHKIRRNWKTFIFQVKIQIVFGTRFKLLQFGAGFQL